MIALYNMKHVKHGQSEHRDSRAMCQSLNIVNDTSSIPAGMNNTIQL